MTVPFYGDESVTLWHGDCLDVLRTLPDASIDAVVTDPPYGLGFMGKAWDAFGGVAGITNPDIRAAQQEKWGTAFAGSARPAKPADGEMAAFQSWCEQWSAECLRVLKPGGHLLAFGGTRTWHRLACAVEDAGFEVRDSIAWLYGSGFPKSRNLDGEWQGWGTALKPAFEPIVVARKQLVGTVAANVLAHGTGALNIDGCRIGFASEADRESAQALAELRAKGRRLGVLGEPGQGDSLAASVTGDSRTGTEPVATNPAGRWPANVVLDESQAVELDRQSGVVGGGGPVRFGPATTGYAGGDRQPGAGFDDTGGASRFFYVAKAPSAERPREDGIAHPTVKPLDLMRWIVRLVTPPGGVVLDPFAGSGTTAEACVIEGFRCIAIEREADYLPLIVARLTKPIQVTMFGDDVA